VLGTLTNIAALEYSDEMKNNDINLNEEELECVMLITEWAANTLSTEADDKSRTIKMLILQLMQDTLTKIENA